LTAIKPKPAGPCYDAQIIDKEGTTMKRQITALIAAAALTVAACDDMTIQERDQVAAGIMGAGIGAVGAKILDADDGWVWAAAAAGAATGVLLARNKRTDECAYSDGRGGYYTAPCR